MLYTDLDAKLADATVGKQIALGGSLYCQKNATGASLMFRYKSPTTLAWRMMKLGTYTPAALAKAEENVPALVLAVEQGVDPQEQKAANDKIKAAGQVSFKDCAEAYIKLHKGEWIAKHEQAWRQTMTHYVYPKMGNVIVGRVTKADVLKVMNAECTNAKGTTGTFWDVQRVTAERTLNRIKLVLDAADAHDLRSGENPASFDVLKHALSTVAHKVKHHTSLGYAKMPGLYAKLAARPYIRSKAVQLVLLTAARIKAVRLATWSQFDSARRRGRCLLRQ